MKISVNEIKNFTDVDISVDELVAKIGAQLGEVEAVVDLGKKYQGIVIAKVISCVKHPNADKLSLCKIGNGKTEVQVVCGAPNVRGGMLVAWLPPGSTVPATFDRDPLVLEAREIRGEMSQGMLASPSELALSSDHSGILELNEGKPGDDFAKTFGLDDHIIDIENKMFTHRPDLFGLLGVAREIAGIRGFKFQSPDWYLNPKFKDQSSKTKDPLLKVKNNAEKLVPRFMIQVMRDVQVKPSPLWLQIYLMKHGMKSINSIVDITNYIMHLTGQPLHAYDLDKLDGSIETRMSKKGDKLKLLNGKEITLQDDSTVLITSNDKPIGIGGVMGGSATEVDDNTKNIALECATFDIYSIRRTSMRYGLFTDAVTRFSKGQSPLQSDKILAFATLELAHQTGGTPASQVHDLKNDLAQQPTISVEAEFINSRLGLDLSAGQMLEILSNVEFVVEITRGDVLVIKPPFWRTDIEIAEDVVEEVGRLYGYDHLPQALPKRNIVPVGPDDLLSLKSELRNQLAKSGANEVLTYSFVHGNLLEKTGQDKQLAYKISNALSPDLQYYRLSLTPSLLDKVHANIKAGVDSFAIFEIGKVHGKESRINPSTSSGQGNQESRDDGLPEELERVSLVFADKNKSDGAAYYQAKRLLSDIVDARFGEINFAPLKDTKFKSHKMFAQMIAPYDEDRSAVILGGDKPLGVVGEFKTSVMSKLKLPPKTAGFELFLNPLLKQKLPVYRPLSKYPSIDQDLTLKTKYDLPFAEISSALSQSLQANLPADIEVSSDCIGIFSKGESSKNTSFRLTAQSHQRTLTTETINQILDKTSQQLQQSLGASRI